MEPPDPNRPHRQKTLLDDVSCLGVEERANLSEEEEEAAKGPALTCTPAFSIHPAKNGSPEMQCGSDPGKGASTSSESPDLVETLDQGREGDPQDRRSKPGQHPSRRSYKKRFQCSLLLDPVAGLGGDPQKPYLSVGCGGSICGGGGISGPRPLARTHRQTSRTDCPVDRLKFFETLQLLLKLTSRSSKRKEREREQRGQESAPFLGLNNEVVWLELQAWHAGRSVPDQDLFLYTERKAIPETIRKVLDFRVDYQYHGSHEVAVTVGWRFADGTVMGGVDPAPAPEVLKHSGGAGEVLEPLRRQQIALEQVERVMELLEAVEALYPSLQALQRDHSGYAEPGFQARVQALSLWLNITQDLDQKLRVLGTVLGLRDPSCLGWPVLEIPSPRCCRGNNKEKVGDHAAESECEEETRDSTGAAPSRRSALPKFLRLLSDDEAFLVAAGGPGGNSGARSSLSHSIYRPFVDKALKQMGLRKLILRLLKLMDRSLQRARAALLSHTPQEFSDFPDPLLYSDYLPELSCHPCHGITGCEEVGVGQDLVAMELPSFQPAFLALCRVLLNVIHECLKLRLEQRPAGEPSVLSIKQLVRECKEVLKGGALMKQYYRFMLRGVISDPRHADANIDDFEEDLHKMLMVYFDYMHNWIQMLQQLPQASHSLKNLLEEEWSFAKVITPYIRGGEAHSARLFCDIARMLLKSTGDFLEVGLQRSGPECQEIADDSMVAGETRRSVIETSRSLKVLFHEARERASKALGFAKMLRKDLEIAAEFSISASLPALLKALRDKSYVQVQIPGIEDLQVFVPCGVASRREVILQLLKTAAGRDCSKEPEKIPDEIADEAYLLLTKHGAWDSPEGDGWAEWEGSRVTLLPQAETVDTLRAMKVENLLLIVTQSSTLVAQSRAFQRPLGDLLTLRSDQTSSQAVTAGALDQLKSEALQLCIKICAAIDRVEYMFTSEFEVEVEESESPTLQQYYREAMIQSYNFAFEYHKEVVRLMSGDFRQRIGERYIACARKWMIYVLTKCESGRGTRPRWATQGFDFLQSIEPAFISVLPEDDFLSLRALMNECIGHVIGKPHSPISGLCVGMRNTPRPVKVPRSHSDPPNPTLFLPSTEGFSCRNVPCDIRTSPCPPGPNTTPQGPWEPRHPKPSTVPNDFRGSHPLESERPPSSARQLQFRSLSHHSSPTEEREEPSYPKGDPNSTARHSRELRALIGLTKDPGTQQTPMAAVQSSIRSFEERRYSMLKQRSIIGQVCHRPKSSDSVMHVGLRKVTFKWQRGNKIGEGQYGKVYTCINVDTGELMAMKEIRFQPNDHKTIKETADELKIFEGIKHPNLVRYFGVELHREEMYIFMEYCDEGTLEEVSRLGLQEHVIRLYSKQITTATNVLHEHGIVHRDIKGANIFLTSSGLIKLGDFGCSVKLKNNAQSLQGEVNSTLGTAAYMAPEVITRAKGEGHGWAADIWSLGCVLIEMVTGKRPWHEYEHNLQIMYRVGMGHAPPIPEKLSAEGKDFLGHCLESDPKQRWSASGLLDHPFVKVCTDEE